MKIKILTLFPRVFDGILGESILKRAIEKEICSVEIIDMRTYSLDKHHHVDDTPYGGGAGMVLACDVVDRAILANSSMQTYKILMTPQGRPYKQNIASELASKTEILLVCGHYEGFDERIRQYVDDEISIGDYILTGGELPAAILCDSIIRLLEHAIRKESSEDDSFSEKLLEYPQYTRPVEYKGIQVPDVLLQGNHKLIREFRLKESLRRTFLRRPDLLAQKDLSNQEKKYLSEIIQEEGISLVELNQALFQYGISYRKITKKINTSKQDFRFIIILDQSYVVRIATKDTISEERIVEMDRLVQRYHQIGIYAPTFIKNKFNKFTYEFRDMICYLSEYADFPLASEVELDEREIRRQSFVHLGFFAQKFTNYDLIEPRSMWSIIDLAPLDESIDEKQENLNDLVNTLRELQEDKLADEIIQFNQEQREKIKQVFRQLPRCVFQGDLNASNLLIKDQRFYGLIDFNLSGTEVNINCFLSETNVEIGETDFKNYKPKTLLKKIIAEQDKDLKIILKNYILNKDEKSVFENFRNIVLISQYPNVCAYQHFLKSEYKSNVIEYLTCILRR